MIPSPRRRTTRRAAALAAALALGAATLLLARARGREELRAVEDDVARAIASEREGARTSERPVLVGEPIDANAAPLYAAYLAGDTTDPTRCRRCDWGFRYEDGDYPAPAIGEAVTAFAAQCREISAFLATRGGEGRRPALEACLAAARAGLDLASEGPFVEYAQGLGIMDSAAGVIGGLVVTSPPGALDLDELSRGLARLDEATPTIARSYERDRLFQLSNLLRHGDLANLKLSFEAPSTGERLRQLLLPRELDLARRLEALEEYYDGCARAFASPEPPAVLEALAAQLRVHRDRVLRTFATYPPADWNAVARHRAALALARAAVAVERRRGADGRYPEALPPEELPLDPRRPAHRVRYEPREDRTGYQVSSGREGDVSTLAR